MKIFLSKQKFLSQGGQALALAGGMLAGSWGLKTLEQRFPTWSGYTLNGVLIAGGLLLANLVGIPLLASVFLGIAATGVVVLSGKLFSRLSPTPFGNVSQEAAYDDSVNAWHMGDLAEAPPAGIDLPHLGTASAPATYSRQLSDEEALLSNQNIL
jgi:hypothetical protein